MAFSRKHFLYAGLGYLVLNLSLFGNVLFGPSGQVLSSPTADLALHFVAWRQFGFEQLRQGHLVLWNTHYLCGNPFFGNFESALLYPPNWLCLFLPLDFALNWGIVLHVVLAGFFTYVWVIRRKLTPLSAFLSGVLFMWGGAYYLHLYAGHLPNLCAMVWAPLIFWAVDGWVEEGSVKWALWGMGAVSLQVLAGHPQYVYFTALVAAVYFLLRVRECVSKVRAIMGFCSFYIGAFLLTAIQSWTGLDAAFHSARHQVMNIVSAGIFSFPPQNLLTIFMPEFFGRLEAGIYWSSWYFWEGSLFLGVVATDLIIVALFQVRNRQWAGTMAVVTALLAFGAYTPIYPIFYHGLPFLSGMRGMGKFIFLTSLFLSLLAGMGLDSWLQDPKKNARIWVSLAVSVMLLALGRMVFDSALEGADGIWQRVLCKLPWISSTLQVMSAQNRDSFTVNRGIQSAWSLAQAGIILLVLTMIAYLATLRRVYLYGLVLLAVCETFLFAQAHRPTFNLSAVEMQERSLARFFLDHPGDGRTYGLGALTLNTPGSDIWEDEPIVPERYARFVELIQDIPDGKLYAKSPVFSSFDKRDGLIRLKYWMVLEDGKWKARVLPFPTMPRVSTIAGWVVKKDPDDQLKTVGNVAFDPLRQAVLGEDPGIIPAHERETSTVKWRDLSTDELEIETTVRYPKILLVTDNYDPGWEAQSLSDSDQKEYRVMPGDYFLRAIPLQAGYHHFLLRYRPWAFEAGKWVSLLSCLLYVAILLAIQRSIKK